MEYSVDQKTAIELSNKNIRILACAGSGKTSTVAAKVAYLLESRNHVDILPENIIAFTFTNRAANELQIKIIEAVGKLQGMANMFVGTIHSWCLAALKEHVAEYQNFDVLDEIKLKLFVDKYYEDIGMADIKKLRSSNHYLHRYADTSIFTSLMDIIRESKTTRELPSNIKEARRKFEETLIKNHYFDFSMCMDKALDCLNKDENLKNEIREKLKYLIVDEYQDINPIQHLIIRKLQELSSCYLIVVGDDDQNIYQWRGSANEFIISFPDYYKKKDVKDVPLYINYRSSEGITTLADSFISNNVNRIRRNKMISDKKQVFERGRDILYNEYSSVEQENQSIADYIKHIEGTSFSEENEDERGITYSDICILLRTWRRAESFADVFDAQDIPYVTAGVNQLFETHEVAAALNIFGFINNDINSDELKKSWLSIPHVKLNKAKLDTAVEAVAKLTPANSKRDYCLQNIFWEFLECADINEDTLASNGSPNQKERAEIILFNLGKFSQVINDFEEINFNTDSPTYHLINFLNFINYAAWDYYPEGWISNEYKTPNAVQIMTIHQAKGLEFPVVIIPGLNRNYIPQKKRGGLNVWHFLERDLITNQERYEPKDNTEDERRLVYVAITRSQKYLLLSRAPDLNNRLYQKESSFMSELNEADILRSDPDFSFFDEKPKRDPEPKSKTLNITLDFTTLKDYFDCSYRFKLVSLYGFRFPLNIRMGLGQSFHNILMELHKKGKAGIPISLTEIENRQTYFPYIGNYTETGKNMRETISKNVSEYYQKNQDSFDKIEFVEQDIQYQIDKEILVLGRIDLVKRVDEYGKLETTIIDFKSKEETQNMEITNDQLLLYALGHKELTGQKADYIMTYVIGGDEPQAKTPKVIHDYDLVNIEKKIRGAADNIRKLEFDKCNDKIVCKDCYQNSLCTERSRFGLKNKRA